MKFKKLIAIVLAVTSMLSISALAVSAAPSTSANVTVKVDGKVVETLSLNEDTQRQFNGVVVVVKNGEIYVTQSTCTDKVCMRSGKASKTGEGIICAPNRVSIQIDGNNADLPDAMTG